MAFDKTKTFKTDDFCPDNVAVGGTAGFPGQLIPTYVHSVPEFPALTFERELTCLINRYSKENESNTPDFILAAYMMSALKAYTNAVVSRETWYGRKVFYQGDSQNVEAK